MPVERQILNRLHIDSDPAREPAPAVLGVEPRAVAGIAGTLHFEDLVTSVEAHFPLILAARTEIEIARARMLGAKGAFDTRLSASGLTDFEGYYENDRVDVSFEQPLRFSGAKLVGGYRLGAGDFADYDGKAKTNEDGELRFGVKLPLLQGRAIDSRRVAEWRAEIELEQAQPEILAKRLETTLKAALTYWSWVASGRRLEISRQLLGLAEDRQAQVALGVEEGQLAPIAIKENQRLIVDRRSKLIADERMLQKAAIELSLFLRDGDGQPIVPADSMLPIDFPEARPPKEVLVPGDIGQALSRRPELRAAELELSKLAMDLSLARNTNLPTVELGVFAAQDLGSAVNTPDDKEEFELTAGLRVGVPLQRSSSRGKAREIQGKMKQQERKLQFARDVVSADVQDAASALRQTWERLEQALENVRLAGDLAEAERIQVRAGESDLFRLNLREKQAALAGVTHVSVLQEHFSSIARYRAVLGVAYDGMRPFSVMDAPGAQGAR
ncbi:MAG: outer membrane protein TolC [Planctomycetota bacterium]|jgi:outer membrane protein TolC